MSELVTVGKTHEKTSEVENLALLSLYRKISQKPDCGTVDIVPSLTAVHF
jgi:hypothetical protein